MEKLLKILEDGADSLPEKCLDVRKRLILTIESMNLIIQNCKTGEFILAAKKIRRILEMNKNMKRLYGKIGELTRFIQFSELELKQIPEKVNNYHSLMEGVKYTGPVKQNGVKTADIQILINFLQKMKDLGGVLEKDYTSEYVDVRISVEETDEEAKTRIERQTNILRKQIEDTKEEVNSCKNEIEQNKIGRAHV